MRVDGLKVRVGGVKVRVDGVKVRVGGAEVRVGGVEVSAVMPPLTLFCPSFLCHYPSPPLPPLPRWARRLRCGLALCPRQQTAR